MVSVGAVYVGVLGVGGAIQLALAAFAWRHGSKPGVRWFAVLATFGAAWVLTDAVGMWFVGAGFPRLWLGNLNSAISTGAAVAWVGFVVNYTGRGHLLTPSRTAAVALLPATTSAVLLAAPTSPLVVVEYGFETVSGLSLVWIDAGPLILAVEVYIFALIFGLFGLILRAIVEEGAPFAGQLAWILGGSLVVLLGAAVDILNLVPVPADVLGPSVGATLQTCAFAVALFRHRLLELVPAVSHLGESDAIEDLDDGVVIVDDDGAVVRLNPAARRVLDVGADGAIGVDVRRLLPELDDGAPAETTVERSGRTYRVTRSAITGRGDRPVGQTFLFRDVTDRERREQRLEVLSRVLRHNLRNDVDAIEGHASFVEHETDGDVARSAGTIRSLALGMAELGDKARLAQETLDDDADPEVVELAPLVDRVVDDAVAALPDYDPDVAVTVPDDAGVATYPTPLAVALGNVVENAIEHAGSTTPTVRVRATVGEGVEPSVDPDDVTARSDGGEANGRRSRNGSGPGDGARTDTRSGSGSGSGGASGGEDGTTSDPASGTGAGNGPASGTGARNGPASGSLGDPDAGPVDPAAEDAGTSGVEIVVEDDGPGIPDHQVAVLEEGAETPLLHGNGIGLWLVHWAVGTLRGDVEFERIPDGSRVRIRVPTLDGDGTDRTRTAEPREGRAD